MSLKDLAKQIKEENRIKNMTINELFIQTIDDYLIKKYKEKTDEEERLAFRPSSYYKCQRQQYYFLSGFPKNIIINAKSVRVLNTGTINHEWVQTKVFMEMNKEKNSLIKLIPLNELPVYGKEGIEFIKEHSAPDMEIKFLDTRFTQKFPISAMIDGAMSFMNKDFIFEYKTINTRDFKKPLPLKDHIKQGAIYSLSLGLRNVMFLYIDKNTQDWEAFYVEYNDEQLNWVVNRLNTIEKYVLSKELPPREEGIQCNYCNYKNYCNKNIKEV